MLQTVLATSATVDYFIQAAHLICQFPPAWQPWASFFIVRTKRSKFDSRILSKNFFWSWQWTMFNGTMFSLCSRCNFTEIPKQFAHPSSSSNDFFFFFSDLTQYSEQGFGSRHMWLWVLTPSWFSLMTLVDSLTLWSGSFLSSSLISSYHLISIQSHWPFCFTETSCRICL